MEIYPKLLDWKNIVTVSILPKAMQRLNEIPIKISRMFFTEIEWINHKRPWIPKAIWEKTTRLQISHFLGSDYTTKLQKSKEHDAGTKPHRWMEQIEMPEINPCTYGQLIYDKGGKNIQWKKDSLFIKQCWKNWTATHKGINIRTFCHSI